MHFPQTILAADDGVKLIGFIIFAVIWGIGALASMVKKANEQARRNAAVRRSAAPVRAAPPVMQPARKMVPSPGSRPPPLRQVQGAIAPAVVQRAQALAQMAARPAAPARPPQRPASAPNAPLSTPQAASQVTAPASRPFRAASANASAIRRWLRPDSLRKQFILTELLQPALALRPDRDNPNQ